MDGELRYDVCQEEVAVVLGGWIHTVLGQQTRPRKRHQATELVTLFPEKNQHVTVNPIPVKSAAWIYDSLENNLENK